MVDIISLEAIRVKHGGLMRCCVGTIFSQQDKEILPTEVGSVVQCQYCATKMILGSDACYSWLKEESDVKT